MNDARNVTRIYCTGKNNYTSRCYIIIQTSDNKIGHEHQYVYKIGHEHQYVYKIGHEHQYVYKIGHEHQYVYKIGHEHQYVLFYFIYFLLFTLQSKHHCLLK